MAQPFPRTPQSAEDLRPEVHLVELLNLRSDEECEEPRRELVRYQNQNHLEESEKRQS